MSKLKLLLFKDKIVYGRERKRNTKVILSSVISIIVALVIALLVSTLMGYNPLDVFVGLFTKGFADPQQLIYYLGVFAIASFAFAISYKGGIFNIGISGQMLAAGTSVVFLIKLFNHFNVADDIPNGAGQVIIVFLAMIVGSLFAFIVGALDVFLKVNSVVSAILLNWIIYFGSFFLLATYAGDTTTGQLIGSEAIPDNFRLISTETGTGGVIPIVIIIIVLSVIMLLIFKFTVFGHKIKSIGFSANASIYSGYKVKKIKLINFMMSGAIAGILACVVYTSGFNGLIPLDSSADAIPNEGFQGIAIALIGNNNPFGIIIISFIFAMFKNAIVGITIPSSYFNVLIGLVMVGATLSVIVIRWKPWCYLQSMRYNKSYNMIQENFDNQFNELMSKYLSIMKWEKQNIYSQNISKHDKEKLWKETLIEIEEDYLTEKDKVFENFKFEKMNLFIEKKLNIIAKYEHEKVKRKNYFALKMSKKITRIRERIKLTESRITQYSKLENPPIHKIDLLKIKIDKYNNEIAKIKNKYEGEISDNLNSLSLIEKKKLINRKKIKRRIHECNMQIATIDSHAQREFFQDKINYYIEMGEGN